MTPSIVPPAEPPTPPPDILARLYQHAGIMCAVVGDDGRLEMVNPAWTATLGRPASELVGRPLVDLVDPADRDRAARLLNGEGVEGVEVEVVEGVELRLLTAEAEPRWCLVRLAADGDGDGDGDGGSGDGGGGQPTLVLATDISSWKEREAALRKRSAQEDVVARTATRFIRVDGDELDAAIVEVLGEVGALEGADRVYLFLHDRTRARTSNTHEWCAPGVEPQQDMLQDLALEQFDWWTRRLDQGQPAIVDDVGALPPEATAEKEVLAVQGIVSTVAVPVVIDGATNGFLGVDVVAPSPRRQWDESTVATLEMVARAIASAIERQRAQERLGRIADVLERRNRDLARSNADLENFAYVASHDLRSPLTLLAGAVDMLSHQLGDVLEPDQQELMGIAVRNAQRLSHLVEDLLAYARVGDALTAQPVDLAELVQESAALVRAEAGGDVTIEVGPLPTVAGDPGLLRQVIENVMSNAVKFARPGVAPVVQVEARRRGRAWEVRVADNGIGIPAGDRDRVFQMFTRLHRHADFPGTGIGLAICARIIDLHGGEIWAEESESGGTRLCFALPAAGGD